MSNYRDFLPEDLAADDSFRRWVLSGITEDSFFWEEWIELNPDKRPLVAKAKRYLVWTYEAFDNIGDEEISVEIDRLSQQIKLAEPLVRPKLVWQKVAASLLVLLGIVWWASRQDMPVQNHRHVLGQLNERQKENTNESTKTKLIVLPDGSNVLLQPQSKIVYPATFEGNKREVFLSGEAFFEVRKDAEKPFFVYANTLVTKVLGTSFKVSAYGDRPSVKVSVKTGRVSVFPLSEAVLETEHAEAGLPEIVLMANEQIVFVPKNQELTRSTIENPADLELAIQRQSFIFKAAKIETVFDALEKSYGIDISYDKEIMKNCYLTADLSDEPLYNKINLICKTIGARYKQGGTKISIISKGCF